MITGICFGAFDILHVGHLNFLNAAKENCDHLTVGLHINPSLERRNKNKPIQTTFERYTQLASCRFVDGILPYDTEEDIENILNLYKYDKRFLGSDYINKEFTGEKICEDRHIEIFYIPRFHNYSSTELRKRLK